MKKILILLSVFFALNLSAQNALITGFNYGNMAHYSHVRNKGILGLTTAEYKTINTVIPIEKRKNVRSSGTVSNYQNINEIGNGTCDYTITWWGQEFSSHNNIFKRLEFTKKVFANDRDWIFKQFGNITDRSFIYDQVEIYKNTGGQTFAFTFNSHMPFIGWTTLDESIKSLEYVKANTNLISVELENESYYIDYITGFGNSAKVYEPNIDDYLKYLEFTVIPEVQKVAGRTMPLGISINNASTSAKHKYWTAKVLDLYDRLTSRGYNIFLVPHIYTSGYDEASIRTAFDLELKTLPKNVKVRITEFNVDAKVGTTNQANTNKFFDLGIKIAKEYPQVDALYYHAMYENKGNVYSFIK